MRDIVLFSIILPLAAAALRYPWIGVLLWVWVSVMNPHRYTYGFAQTAPVAMIAGLAVIVGFLFSRDKRSPFQASPVTWLALFVVWVTLSWLLGRDPSGQFGQWDKVMKVYLMVFITLMVMRSKQHIMLLAWVMTLSVGLLAAKGGVFTIMTGGAHRVWGPPGSWIEGNNDFAVATIMVIPLLRFMQLQVTNKWLSRGLLAMMLLCAASALGSHSRGALLAIVAMTTVLWWRGQNKGRNGIILITLGLVMVAAMPSNWSDRMETIQTYEEDLSALGRLSAWWVSWRIAQSEIFGVGFSINDPALFEAFSPYGLMIGTPVAHSIWFQMLGHHGFVGFALFVGLWLSTWRVASRLRRESRGRPELKWASDLGGMTQVCLVGYWAGGAFLQLGYYDFPYYVMVLVVLTHTWVRHEQWRTDVPQPGGWRHLIGISQAANSLPVKPAPAGERPGGEPRIGVGRPAPGAVVSPNAGLSHRRGPRSAPR